MACAAESAPCFCSISKRQRSTRRQLDFSKYDVLFIYVACNFSNTIAILPIDVHAETELVISNQSLTKSCSVFNIVRNCRCHKIQQYCVKISTTVKAAINTSRRQNSNLRPTPALWADVESATRSTTTLGFGKTTAITG